MSIASEISRLQTAKTDIKTAIEAKGVTVPSSAKIDVFDDYIAQISTEGSYQSKTVSPTTSSQTVTADGGYDALSSVTINAIPTTTSPRPTISVNTDTGLITASHAQTTGYISQDTTTTRTHQLLTNAGGEYNPEDLDSNDPDLYAIGMIMLAKGTMLTGNLIVNDTKDYVGSQVPRKSSSDLTASGATITVPAGYYSTQATKSVSSGSATAPASISGSSATVSTGTNTLTLSKTISVTPSVSAGYVSAGTAGNSSVSLTASVTTKAAATITPGTSNQTIASGTYLTGTQTISGDADLIAANIKKGVQIFNVTGSYTSDATAAASDIVDGETAYVDGNKITGSLVINKYYTGSTVPSSSLGSDGDIYLQS